MKNYIYKVIKSFKVSLYMLLFNPYNILMSKQRNIVTKLMLQLLNRDTDISKVSDWKDQIKTGLEKSREFGSSRVKLQVPIWYQRGVRQDS